MRRRSRRLGVAGRRLHVDPAKRREAPDPAVGDRVHGAAAGERDIPKPRALLQRRDQMKEGLLVHRLHRARDVVMTTGERLVGMAARTKQLFQRGREQIAKLRRA